VNELDAAKRVRDGALLSPTRFGRAWLYAIRISGTGSAERPALGESTYRPPEVWTSPEMLTRAAGLPVLLGHPEGGLLTSDEHAMRVIGACVLPYEQDGELWTIARIVDEAGFHAMKSGTFSTSPGVALGPDGGTKIEGSAGTLLIERDPALLDHVAIIPNDLTSGAGGGVWDKGGPGTGIRNDATLKEKPMADENNGTLAKPDDDLNSKLDKLVSGMSAVADMCSSLGSRMDALEKTAGPKSPSVERADSSGEDVIEMDETRGRGLAEAGDRAQEAAKADAQGRADSLAQAFGERAPPPMSGERPLAYRVRLAKRYQRHSPEFKEVDLGTVNDAKVFDGIESRIYADAAKAAEFPDNIPNGHLREVTRVDPYTGARVTSFYGNNTTFISQLKRPSLRVTDIRTTNRNN
jgi:hypothetical protein